MKGQLILASMLVLTACSSGSDSPTSPASSALAVEAFSTATQNEPGGFRLQLRLRVLEGEGPLRDAVNRGAARARTCSDGTCSEASVTGDFREAACPAMAQVGFLDVAVGTAWLNDDVVGIDVCVSELVDGMLFETSLEDGFNRSNTIQTSCATGSGGVILCGSD